MSLEKNPAVSGKGFFVVADRFEKRIADDHPSYC
jgi:hypothetical protein